jgi:hypothetical protein
MILSDATVTRAMFDPHPPLVWKKSKSDLVIGGGTVIITGRIDSPCHLYTAMNNTAPGQTDDFVTWCNRSFREHVEQKLMNFDHHLHRHKRAVGAALLAALAAIPGVGWVAIAVVAVVIVGVAGYTLLHTRMNSAEDEIQRQKNFSELVKTDLKELKDKHNLLSTDFRHSQRLLPQLVTTTADISTDLFLIGQQLEDGIAKWHEGKVSNKLFKAFNITLDCGINCPLRLAEPLNVERNGTSVVLTIVVAILDSERETFDADPFTLISFEGNLTCFHKYTGEMKLSMKRGDRNDCTLAGVNHVYQSLYQTSDRSTCHMNVTTHPWSGKECIANAELVPQIKRVGALNVIYCKGQSISVGGSQPQPCPDHAFALSITQSFAIDNDHVYSGRETRINSHHEVSMHMQNKINSQLLPGVDPYAVTLTTSDFDLHHRPSVWTRTVGGGTLLVVLVILTLVMVLLTLFAYRKKLFTKTKKTGREIEEAETSDPKEKDLKDRIEKAAAVVTELKKNIAAAGSSKQKTCSSSGGGDSVKEKGKPWI